MKPDLDRHRVREKTRSPQPTCHESGITEQDRFQLISGNKISFKCVFDGDRLGFPIWFDRPVVAGVRQIHQSLRMGLADHLSQLVEPAALQIGHRVNANTMQLVLADRANARDDRYLHRS